MMVPFFRSLFKLNTATYTSCFYSKMPYFPKDALLDVFVSDNSFDYPWGMFRGVETLIYFRVSLNGRIYKFDITCVAQNSAQIRRLKQLRWHMTFYKSAHVRETRNYLNVFLHPRTYTCGLFERLEDINNRQHQRVLLMKI